MQSNAKAKKTKQNMYTIGWNLVGRSCTNILLTEQRILKRVNVLVEICWLFRQMVIQHDFIISSPSASLFTFYCRERWEETICSVTTFIILELPYVRICKWQRFSITFNQLLMYHQLPICATFFTVNVAEFQYHNQAE